MDQKPMNIRINNIRAQYSNFVIIQYRPEEFILDFAVTMPQDEGADLTNRVILAPAQTKRLLELLKNNVRNYEHVFGEIKLFGEPPDEDQIHRPPEGEQDDE